MGRHSKPSDDELRKQIKEAFERNKSEDDWDSEQAEKRLAEESDDE
jgi:hypothetical protein